MYRTLATVNGRVPGSVTTECCETPTGIYRDDGERVYGLESANGDSGPDRKQRCTPELRKLGTEVLG